MSEWDDYAADNPEKPAAMGENAKSVFKSLLADRDEAIKAVEDAEEALDEAKKRLKSIEEHTIPNTFTDMGLDDSTVLSIDGMTLTIGQETYASIKAENRPKAHQFIRDFGDGRLIKHEVKIKADSEEEADKLVKENPNATSSTSVHASTLKSWVTKRIKAGDEIPLDLFGAFQKRVAKVKVG